MWVEKKLTEEEIKPVRLRRIKSEIPQKIPRVNSGKELLTMAATCLGSYTDYSNETSEEESDLIGSLFQDVQDWVDLYSGLEPAERIRAARSLDEQIKELEAHGFSVFATTENQKLEGGISSPSTFKILHLAVFKNTDPNVVMDTEEAKK